VKHAVLLSLALLAPTTAQAAGNLALSSNVFVERTEVRGGKDLVILSSPDRVTPGDRLVFVLNYRNTSAAPATNMVVTNPLPQAVTYQDAEGAQVSVDGGHSWGSLAQARIKTASGAFRPARPDDVTHIRWQLTGAIPAGATGKLKFRGTVR